MIAKSTGSYLSKDYYDIINPKPEDTRSGEEVLDDTLNTLSKKGLVVTE